MATQALMSPISLKDTWFMRELKSYLILKLLVSPWHLIFLPPNHHQHQFLCMLWHCYGNPEGWRNSLHLSSQRVMRQEWWIVCWKLCSRGLPSATEEKGHQSQKVNIILVSCYFLGNYHKEQLFFFFLLILFKSCVKNVVLWAAALQKFHEFA